MLKTYLAAIRNRIIKADERKWLLKILPQHSIGAEIGVWKGNFSERILKTVQPKRLHLIDPYLYRKTGTYRSALYGGKAGSQKVLEEIYNSVREKFKEEIAVEQVVMHRQLSEAATREFPDEYFDWIYIDGDHQYEFVKKDLEMFYPKVKTNGLIAGDDYDNAGWWQGGVKKAVDEFLTTGKVKLIKLKKNQFILQKIS